jgi:hypothetical protein
MVMTGQSAATASSATSLSPDIVSVNCGAADVWLEFLGSTGLHCYTGTGELDVDLPGVVRFQVVGVHSGSIVSTNGEQLNFAGPRTFTFSPPVTLAFIAVIS